MVTHAHETNRNLTIQLDGEMNRRAKVLAAREGTSVSRLVADTIRRLVTEDSAFETARTRALARLDRGFHWGGGRIDRDDLHERRATR